MLQQTFIITGSAGRPIHGDVCMPSETAKATVIFIHGFKGFKDWGAHNLAAKFFAGNGYRYLKFNLSHSGVTKEDPDDISNLETFGNNTFTKELEDINRVIGYASEKFPAEPVYLIGHSRGGGLAILQAGKDRRVKKLATWASVSDFRNLWKPEQETEWLHNGVIYNTNARTKQQMPLYSCLLEDYLANSAQLNILEAAGRITIPWLIIHGDQDPGVPVSMADDLASENKFATLLKIPGGDHVFGAKHPYEGEVMPEQLRKVCEETIVFFEVC